MLLIIQRMLHNCCTAGGSSNNLPARAAVVLQGVPCMLPQFKRLRVAWDSQPSHT